MKEHDTPLHHAVLEQVYLVERDTGLLVRILGLYAARGIDVRRADYAYAAPDVMTLKVTARIDAPSTAETLRTLVEKAATLFGMIAAAEQPPAAGARVSSSTNLPQRGTRLRRTAPTANSAPTQLTSD